MQFYKILLSVVTILLRRWLELLFKIWHFDKAKPGQFRKRSFHLRLVSSLTTRRRTAWPNSPEFRNEALKLAERIGVAAAVRELSLYKSQLYAWRSKQQQQLTSSERESEMAAENTRLKRQLTEQAEELVILQKAATSHICVPMRTGCIWRWPSTCGREPSSAGHMSPRMTAQLVCDALQMALWRRKRPENVIVHTDRDGQYCLADYQALLKHHNLRRSMSAKGCCYDNACTESFFHSLKVECIHGERFICRERMRRLCLIISSVITIGGGLSPE